MVEEWWVLTEVNILTGNFYPDEPVDEVRGRVGRRRRRGERNRRRAGDDGAVDQELFGQYEEE
jgi:hypothetical protein